MARDLVAAYDQWDMINRVAEEEGVRPAILHSLVRRESSYNPKAVNTETGASGLLQLMPATAKELGVSDVFDPEQNVRGGAKYFKQHLKQFNGDERMAVGAHFAGAKGVQRAMADPANNPLTHDYIKDVVGHAGPVPEPEQKPVDLVAMYDEWDSKQKPEAATPPPAAPESAGSRFVKGAWENLNPIAAVQSVKQAVMHPLDTASNIIDSQLDQFKKAKADYDQGHYSEMLGHGVAGALPLIGPAAARAGETIATGDVAGGLGQGVGLVGSVVGPGLVNKGLVKAGLKTQTAAERLVNSNVKPTRTLQNRNSGVNIPRVILDEKFKPGAKGAAQAIELTKKLSGEVTDLAAADTATGRTYSQAPVGTELRELATKYDGNPVGASDAHAVRMTKRELLQNDLFGEDVLNAKGEVIGRRFKKLNATEINDAKKAVYEANPKSFGEVKGARIQAEKATARGYKNILNQNVPGVEAINARQSGVIAARKALTDMASRESNKYPFGLMDMIALSGGLPTALGFGAVKAGILALKHPSTAFPIARGIDRVGKTLKGSLLRTAGRTVGAGAVLNAGQTKRKPPLTEAKTLYDEYLARTKS